MREDTTQLRLIQFLVCYLLISDVGADHLLVPPDGRDEVPLAQNL